MTDEKQLNYIARLILQSFEETGLDRAYIEDKRFDFLEHDGKYDSLFWACRNLDETRTAVFAKKLGVTPADLDIVLKVFRQC